MLFCLDVRGKTLHLPNVIIIESLSMNISLSTYQSNNCLLQIATTIKQTKYSVQMKIVIIRSMDTVTGWWYCIFMMWMVLTTMTGISSHVRVAIYDVNFVIGSNRFACWFSFSVSDHWPVINWYCSFMYGR